MAESAFSAERTYRAFMHPSGQTAKCPARSLHFEISDPDLLVAAALIAGVQATMPQLHYWPSKTGKCAYVRPPVRAIITLVRFEPSVLFK